jgi:hypothetical protein
VTPQKAADGTAVLTGLFASLKLVSWADWAGFFSCVYLVIRTGFYLWDRYHGRKGDE